MDKIEKFITENRSELDRYTPDPEIWIRIGKNSTPGLLIAKRVLLWAAAVAILITSTLIFIPISGRSILFSGRSEKSNPDLIETEIYYSNKVNSLIEEASPLLTSFPEIENDMLIEIAELDKLYLEIRKDLKDNVSNEEVMEALIENYRVKIEILQEILEMLDDGESNDDNNKSYEI